MSAARHPVQFRALRVAGVIQPTPRVRRLRLTGEDLQRFATGGIHARFLIPPKEREPVWPRADSAGLPLWPTGRERLTLRTYTIREIDAGEGWLDVDVVLHDPEAPGVRWANEAQRGDPVGIMGPGGEVWRAADWYCLAGDETAVPAIARILRELPASARGVAFCEVADRREEEEMPRPQGIELVWLRRDGSEPGAATLLQDAVASVGWPGKGRIYAWAGAEFSAFRALRHHFRKKGLRRMEHRALAHWRRDWNPRGRF